MSARAVEPSPGAPGPLRVGVVAGEASGDYLGAGVMQALQARVPDVRFEGVAGPRMVAAGCRALASSEEISLVGLVEVVRRLPRLIGLKRRLVRHFAAHPPDVFLGIDVPDFNLRLERRLKAAGIPTAHYVGPQVWAWRPGRVRGIRALDLMLTLFPFETEFYREHGVGVRFVGHPLADEIPFEVDQIAARDRLALAPGRPTVALLPGSRVGELRNLADVFVGTAARVAARVPEAQFVAPMAGASTRALFEAALARCAGTPPVRVIDGESREAMAAADVVVAASGTATLEAMLFKRPTVVAYRLSPVTYWLARRMVRLSHYALPNLLAGEEVAPEFMQNRATPENLGEAVCYYLTHPQVSARLAARFARIHETLRCEANARAAEAILDLVRARSAESGTQVAVRDGRAAWRDR